MDYDGESLFGKHVDDALQTTKADTDTARSLGNLQRSFTFQGSRVRGSSYYRENYQRFQQYQPHSYQGHQYGLQQGHQQQYRQTPPASYNQQSPRKQSQ